MTIIMNGKELSEKIYFKLKKQIKKGELRLGVIMVGDNSSSEMYVKIKEKKCSELKIETEIKKFEESANEEDIINTIQKMNEQNKITGILVQLPLPKRYNARRILDCIDPKKDVDCLTTTNLGKILTKTSTIGPCTPEGIITLLEHYKIDVSAKNIVIINDSTLIGKPLCHMLLNKQATITVCHINTKNLKDHTTNADIVISATGVPKLINKDMIKKESILIDVGAGELNGKIQGDVDFESVKDLCSHISPVPGGVGPLTVAMLINNLISLKRNQKEENN